MLGVSRASNGELWQLGHLGRVTRYTVEGSTFGPRVWSEPTLPALEQAELLPADTRGGLEFVDD